MWRVSIGGYMLVWAHFVGSNYYYAPPFYYVYEYKPPVACDLLNDT